MIRGDHVRISVKAKKNWKLLDCSAFVYDFCSFDEKSCPSKSYLSISLPFQQLTSLLGDAAISSLLQI